MNPLQQSLRNEKGWTLIELMLVMTMISIITPAITFLFLKCSQGFAADEMRMSLGIANEQTLLRMHLRLVANKHMFQNDSQSEGVSFLNLRVTAVPTPPPVLSGSTLPVSQQGTTISFAPGLSVASEFGNSLFFAAYDYPTTIGHPFSAGAPQSYIAPITVAGSSITYGASNGGGPATVILDVYRFYYYYLTPTTHPIREGNFPLYGIVEWRSIQYVDKYEIGSITDSSLKTEVITWLATTGNVPGGAILNAYDPTQTLPASGGNYAFYTLSSAGSMASVAQPTIQQSDWTYLTQTPTGMMSSGFGYGICSNSATWVNAPPNPVPEYGTVNGSFPGGFETGIVGSGAELEVLTRCMLVAQGGAPKAEWNDQTMVHNSKDTW